MERIERLRKVALNRYVSIDEFYYRFYKCYNESQDPCEFGRYANAFYYAFSELTPNITDGELIVGEAERCLTEAQVKEWDTVYRDIAQKRCELAGGSQDSHMAIDYDLILSCGLNGIIKIPEKLFFRAERLLFSRKNVSFGGDKAF